MDEATTGPVRGDLIENEAHTAEPVSPPRRRGRRIPVILLSVALALAVGGLVYGYFTLRDANAVIDKQRQQIQEQEELIDTKQTFGAAMQGLMSTVAKFDGVPFAALVDIPAYQAIATRAWDRRWYAAEVQAEVVKAQTTQSELAKKLTGARAQATSNATGTALEGTVDQLGRGFVASVLEDVRPLCGRNALACVFSDDPYTVHFNTTSNNQPWMTDFIRTGIAYHEFAHVLQFTNPEPTKPAVAAFGGDVETMADCFALTYVPGWSLDQRVYISSRAYYDVIVGYGYTCNDDQKQVIRGWYEKLQFRPTPISQ
jgi:hypothetical protein